MSDFVQSIITQNDYCLIDKVLTCNLNNLNLPPLEGSGYKDINTSCNWMEVNRVLGKQGRRFINELKLDGLTVKGHLQKLVYL